MEVIETGINTQIGNPARSFQHRIREPFLVAGGEELRNIRTDAGQVLTFNLKKLHLESCSNSDFVGSFGYSGEGKFCTARTRPRTR